MRTSRFHSIVVSGFIVSLLSGIASAAVAQDPVQFPAPPAPEQADTTASRAAEIVEVDRGHGFRIAKWSVLTAATGAAIYGFAANRRADNRYERLEQTCVEEPERCASAPPAGPYTDPLLEAEYQDIRSMDRRAKTALLASQIGVAAAVVLFILDLRNSDAPGNIPYEPRSFDVGPSRDGGLSMSWQLKVH